MVPRRVIAERVFLLMFAALYVAYRLGAPDLVGFGVIEALIHNLRTH
ncbi:MAG TPA: hypothetical protein VGL02_29165 [Streptomyces sp.]